MMKKGLPRAHSAGYNFYVLLRGKGRCPRAERFVKEAIKVRKGVEWRSEGEGHSDAAVLDDRGET